MAALPVVKLVGLMVKTLSKPISKRIKADLASYDMAKKIVMRIGRAEHKVESYMTIWSSGYRVKAIKKIKDEEALKNGAEFVGEGFVYTVSAGVIIYEYRRSGRSAERKAEEKRERIRESQRKLQAKLETLDLRIKAVEDLIKEQQHVEETTTLLTRVVPVGATHKPKYIEPPKELLVPIADSNDEEDFRSATVSSKKQDAISDKNQQRQSSSWWKFW